MAKVPEPLATVQPDAAGWFTFDEVALGEWRVEANHPAYQTRDAMVMVEPVETFMLVSFHWSTTLRSKDRFL